MPSPKSTHRRVQEEKSRRGRSLNEKSSSFHGQISDMATPQLRRPKTVPDMASFRNTIGITPATELRPKLTKLLLNVTIQGSVGAIHVVMPPESTVKDLVTAAIRQYGKEGRRPILTSVDPSLFDLHYSQFSLESKCLMCFWGLWNRRLWLYFQYVWLRHVFSGDWLFSLLCAARFG